MFTEELPYKNGSKDKLAIFDGNIAVAPAVNGSYGVQTIISFRRVKKPTSKNIGDETADLGCKVNGHAFHFVYPESVQVVIDALEEIKKDMEANQHLINNIVEE